MKKYFLLFAVGLLACAGSRETDIWDDAPGSPMTVCFGDDENGKHSFDCLHPPDSSLTWVDESISESIGEIGFSAPADLRSGGFIIAKSAVRSDTLKNKSDDKKPKPFFHKIDSSIGFNFSRAPHKIFDEHKAQQFDIRVTITFPRMTLQQAAELEARVRKIFPEAQEIDFGLEKKVEVPAESFYYDMPDGVEFRILPGLTFPLQDLKNGNILKADSTGTPAWKVF